MEDVQWVDGATLDLLRFLARRVGSLPVLLLVSYRDDEVGAQHPLAVALGDVATYEALTRIVLTRLSRDAVAVLAAGSVLNADELHRLTGGNPFFVTEILAAGRDALGDNALPRSVSEAVWGRLARLSAPARDAAHAAAICGPHASARLLDQVCPGVAAALDECLDAGVPLADGAAVAFRHELARRAVLEQIPAYRRRELHKCALAALAQPPVPPDTLSALAFHAEQAGHDAAAARFGPAAAQRAAAVGAHREAAELYALALRHADHAPKQQRVKWLEAHAFESYVCGLAEAATRSWREAIALRHDLGDRLGEGEDLRWLSQMLWPLGRSTEATTAARASLQLLEDLAPGPQLAWSLVNLAALAAFRYDPGRRPVRGQGDQTRHRIGRTSRGAPSPRLYSAGHRSAHRHRLGRAGGGVADPDGQQCAGRTRRHRRFDPCAGPPCCTTIWNEPTLHHRDDCFCRDHDLGAFQPALTAPGAGRVVPRRMGPRRGCRP